MRPKKGLLKMNFTKNKLKPVSGQHLEQHITAEHKKFKYFEFRALMG